MDQYLRNWDYKPWITRFWPLPEEDEQERKRKTEAMEAEAVQFQAKCSGRRPIGIYGSPPRLASKQAAAQQRRPICQVEVSLTLHRQPFQSWTRLYSGAASQSFYAAGDVTDIVQYARARDMQYAPS